MNRKTLHMLFSLLMVVMMLGACAPATQQATEAHRPFLELSVLGRLRRRTLPRRDRCGRPCPQTKKGSLSSYER